MVFIVQMCTTCHWNVHKTWGLETQLLTMLYGVVYLATYYNVTFSNNNRYKNCVDLLLKSVLHCCQYVHSVDLNEEYDKLPLAYVQVMDI